jgi:hypothetical protein
VDNIIIVSSSSSATERLLQQFQREFAVKDHGKLSYFLGIKVHHSFVNLILTQHKYVHDLLLRTNMENSKGITTSMLPTEKLLLRDSTPLSSANATNYRSMVGVLQYLSFIQLDISFSINRVCQFLSAPTTSHWTAVKHILCYL